MKTDAGLCWLDGVSSFSSYVFGTMVLETGVSEKVSSTGMATLGGFETALVSVEKIRTLFLETGAALEFGFDSGDVLGGCRV